MHHAEAIVLIIHCAFKKWSVALVLHADSQAPTDSDSVFMELLWNLFLQTRQVIMMQVI